MSTRITDELRSWIGREATYTAPEEFGAAAFRRTRHGGVIAPPTFVCETNQIVRHPPDENGYIGHSWPLPLPSTRFIRGGNEYEFIQPVRPDDLVTVTWKIVDIYEREARKHGMLVFVVSEGRYVNQRCELLAINRETNIYSP
jgi:acyl dehydratase